MEILKGLHYITFLFLSFEEPLFLFIQYLNNVLHFFNNKYGYSKPYEKSLFYSFFLCFFLINLTRKRT
jgi:hypothetical protein